MTTLSELKLKVIGVLGDEQATEDDEGNAYTVVRGTTYDDAILLNGIHAALKRISSKVWKPSIYELETESSAFDLPSDLLDVEGVYDKEIESFLPRLQFVIGRTSQLSVGNAWFLYPHGSITFVNALGEEGATLYYSAGWSLPAEDTDTIDSPLYAETALILYAASYCLLQQASESAEVRQFNTKVDAGAPTDIPAKDMSTYFLSRFEAELLALPVTEKAIR